jgi:hypothetical protein
MRSRPRRPDRDLVSLDFLKWQDKTVVFFIGVFLFNILTDVKVLMICFVTPHISNRHKMWSVKVCQWLATGRWFSPGAPVSSTNKTDHHDITEILLKVALNTIKQTRKKPRRGKKKCQSILKNKHAASNS